MNHDINQDKTIDQLERKNIYTDKSDQDDG
jgi:hypothetical protein